jgi:glucoamylase
MPRDLPVGNGRLLVNFDAAYALRDVYFPHVGQENQTEGHINRFGIWVDDEFHWIHAGYWQVTLDYEDADTLVTKVSAQADWLGLTLVFSDCVDFDQDVYLKRVHLFNHRGRERRIRLFQHLDPHLWSNGIGDTVFFEPDSRALVAYKGRRYLWLSAATEQMSGFEQWATGKSETGWQEGAWRDAEDGKLSGNPIAQGNVDAVGGVSLTVPANQDAVCHFWLAAGRSYQEVRAIHDEVTERGPQSFIDRTRIYWRTWSNKEPAHFADLPQPVRRLYRRSLLILRTQIDEDGAIIAANDADVLQFGRDTYSYLWPRDGALVAHALINAGYGHVSRRFFEFCARVISEDGYFLHKYNPDGSPGSSWHPWIGSDGAKQLPIQEDETALVLWAFWAHFRRFRDIEFVRPIIHRLVHRAADFLCRFREPRTGLPAASYDLWEERYGIHAYTTATVVAGLEAAANLAEVFGDVDHAGVYRHEAAVIRAAATQHLYNVDTGCFSRLIRVQPDGAIERDDTIDASIAGVIQFGLIEPHDPRALSSLKAIEQTLSIQTAVGGVARYYDDYHQQVSQDLETVPGNPWFICTLWLADWRIALARTVEDLERPRETLVWVAAHALASGTLAEQIHPYTGQPLSVSPLTWSHATLVDSVHRYVSRHAILSSVDTAEP